MFTRNRLLVLMLAILLVFSELPFACAAGNGGKTSIKDATVTISELIYTGQVQKPEITVKIGQVTLVENTDYNLEFATPTTILAGKYKVTINGIGNYTGKRNEQYEIKPKKITPAVTISKKEFEYNGASQKPTVTAVKDDTVTVAASDYSVDFPAESKNVGAYTLTVTMKGNYEGTATVKYIINPKGTSLKTPAKGSKLITVKWAKQASLMSESRITGYQIMMATNSKFTKNKKTINIKGYSKTSRKVTKLQGRKKYYIKIRTYMTVGGVKYYSKWSKTKTVTTQP